VIVDRATWQQRQRSSSSRARTALGARKYYAPPSNHPFPIPQSTRTRARAQHYAQCSTLTPPFPRGNRGLEADQRTLAAHSVYAYTATTALTAQNTQGVRDVFVTPPGFVEKQIRAVLEDGFLEEEDYGGCGGVVKIGKWIGGESELRAVGDQRSKALW
jgi:hypothetical protein